MSSATHTSRSDVPELNGDPAPLGVAAVVRSSAGDLPVDFGPLGTSVDLLNADGTGKAPIDAVYEQLNGLFGTDENQRLVLEFPGRLLDAALYSYPTETIYSQITKPRPVVEAEFRLSDALLNLDQVTGGPNGKRLSTAYASILNWMVPRTGTEQVEFSRDKQKVRAWLLEHVAAVVAGPDGLDVPVAMSRIEIYQLLTTRYLAALSQWREEKASRLTAAQGAPDPERALAAYARWLAEGAAVHEAGLEALFDEAVVKGYYHEIREMLGLLDVKTPSELLGEAKEAVRASGMSSLDETETVYPVQFQPSDWFTSLATNFSPVDLLLDPQQIQQQLVNKQTLLNDLQLQTDLLLGLQAGDPKALQAAVDAAQQVLDDATTSLTGQFMNNVITVAKIYLASKPANPARAEANKALEKAGISSFQLTDQNWADIQKGINAVGAGQQKLTEASQRLAQALAARAAAVATDATGPVTTLRSQMAQLRASISELQGLLLSPSAADVLHAAFRPDGSYDPARTPGYLAARGSATSPAVLLPDTPPDNGNWETLTLHFGSSQTATKSALSTSAANLNFHVNMFLGSAGGNYSSSTSTATSGVKMDSLVVDIGLRVTKVVIDRGSWFDANVLDETAAMYHVDGAGAHHVPLQTALPGYPVAFVIAKDVTIKVSSAGSDMESYRAVRESASTTSGGLFCFSISSSSTSSANNQSFYSAATDEAVVIRIPQPQILGWFLQIPPSDKSTDYEALPPGFLPDAPEPQALAHQAFQPANPRFVGAVGSALLPVPNLHDTHQGGAPRS